MEGSSFCRFHQQPPTTPAMIYLQLATNMKLSSITYASVGKNGIFSPLRKPSIKLIRFFCLLWIQWRIVVGLKEKNKQFWSHCHRQFRGKGYQLKPKPNIALGLHLILKEIPYFSTSVKKPVKSEHQLSTISTVYQKWPLYSTYAKFIFRTMLLSRGSRSSRTPFSQCMTQIEAAAWKNSNTLKSATSSKLKCFCGRSPFKKCLKFMRRNSSAIRSRRSETLKISHNNVSIKNALLAWLPLEGIVKANRYKFWKSYSSERNI